MLYQQINMLNNDIMDLTMNLIKKQRKRNRNVSNIINIKTQSKMISKKRHKKGSIPDTTKNDMDLSMNPINRNKNISNITKVPQLDEQYSKFYRLNQLLKSTDSEEHRQKLLKGSLSAISQSFQKLNNNVEKELKIHKRINQTAINQIDQQILTLSQQKKQLKIEMSEFNKAINDKIDLLLSHKTFIDKILIKYKSAIQNKFQISQIPWPFKDDNDDDDDDYNIHDNDGHDSDDDDDEDNEDNIDDNKDNDDNDDHKMKPKDNYICNFCGHYAIDSNELNSHLVKHEKKNHQILSSSQWKDQLIKVIEEYSFCVNDYEEKILHQMLKSQKPLLPPSKPINPNKIYNINPQNINNLIHNENVLKNYYKSTKKYPNTKSSGEVMMEFFQLNKKLDFRDEDGRYLKAVITAIDVNEQTESAKVLIHFEGFPNTYNVWINISTQHQRFAVYGSISDRKSINRQCMQYIKLKPGNISNYFLEVRPLHLYNINKNKNTQDYDKYLNWYPAKIVLLEPPKMNPITNKLEIPSAQVKCVLYKYCYETNKWFEPSQTEANVYWVHLDNDEECQSMNTRWNLDK